MAPHRTGPIFSGQTGKVLPVLLTFQKSFYLISQSQRQQGGQRPEQTELSGPVRNVEPSIGGENLDLMQFPSGSSSDSECVRAARRHA